MKPEQPTRLTDWSAHDSATAVPTGILALDKLISGPSDECRGYPLGRFVEFLVDEGTKEDLVELLTCRFPLCSSVHRVGPGINGKEMFKRFWEEIRGSGAPNPMQVIYDMGAGMEAEERYQNWSSLHPKLSAVLRKDERAFVVGFSVKGKDTVIDRAYSSVRIDVVRLERGYRFTVLKSNVSGAAQCVTTLRHERLR